MSDRARTCICGYPLHKDSQDVICSDCVKRTRHHLANQAYFHDSLATELARLTKKVAENDGGRATSETAWIAAGDKHLDEVTPENLREWDRRARAASNALSAQRVLLVSWTKLLVEEGYAADLPADSIPALAMFIEAHLSDVRKHDAAGELVSEFRDLTKRILKVIDLPEFKMRATAGPCPELYTNDLGTKDHCPGSVEMVVPHDETQESYLECKECKKRWDPTQFARAGELILRREAEMKASEDMARKWRKAS